MNFIIYGIYVLVILIVLLSLFNLKLSIALYVSYLILVPYLQLRMGGVTLSYNVVNTIILIAFLYQFWIKRKMHLSFKTISPFLFLYFSLLILSFFSSTTPWSAQFYLWRISFMPTCFVTFIVWNISLVDSKILAYIKWALIISIAIALIYGLYLMQLGGTNPYISFLSSYFKETDMAEALSSGESRLSFTTANKIQSTMFHPMTWVLNLCFLIIIFVTYSYKEKKKWYWVLILLMAFNVLVSGVRTGIAALIIGSVYFLLMKRQVKLIIYGLGIFVISYFVIKSDKDLSNIFASFTDISGTKSDVSGSSISSRLDQFNGSIKEIQGCELVGKGYGWNIYYMRKKGEHPVILAFESLIFVVLCNGGIIGICIWIVFFLLLFRMQRKIFGKKEDIFLMDSFVFVYLCYSIGTGEYGYSMLFSQYYIFLISSLIKFNEKDIFEKWKIYEQKSKGYSLLSSSISSNTGK